ncbi:E3 ubiquitin-protein ligase Midline-1-like [Asterias rubens]|uniref:E3 ubiquitin-protein ligase Midline-1-like n=1 Tax=Asterias rubens TaxID=7604 RepID=UPI0014555EFB|nr:E3 ubiquitin-protein ligase Midline-1-like [Asterias rubens]
MAGKKSDAEVSAVLSKISKNHLECVICHERYNEPKILECLHNFCERCLATYQKSSGDPSIIKCPVCRKKMTFAPGTDVVATLKTNFHLVSMVEDFTLQEQLTQPEAEKMICELCTEHQEAKSRCMDCQFFICPSCKAIHQRISGMAGHDIVALDTLRSGAVGLRSKAHDEPPCERHRGEKKRFYCLTCNQLICRDCTVVEHRDPTHKFTTVDEAAARGRETTRGLCHKVQKNLKIFEEASTELTKMNTDMEKSMVLARQKVTDQAARERRKIALIEASIAIDISKRQNIHTQLLSQAGVKITSQTSSKTLPPTKDASALMYSKQLQEKLANLDSSLRAFGNTIESLLETHDTLDDLSSDLQSAAAQKADEDKSKVGTSLDHLFDSIELRKSTIKEVCKMTSDDVLHMRQTLETTSDAVKSSSNVDFLSLHPVLDSHLRVLFAQSPRTLPLGYSKMVFKSSNDTALGEITFGGSPTWTFAREIKLDGGRKINSMATSSDDEILVSSHAYLQIFRTTGDLDRWTNKRFYGGLITAFPGGDTFCCRVHVHGMSIQLYSNACSMLKSYAVPSAVEQDGSQISLGHPVNMAYYRDREIIISYSNWKGIIVVDTSNGSMVRKIPVDIEPDFLACTSRGRILVASREPARVECLDENYASSFTIHPTVTGSSHWKRVICSGLCRNSWDTIYVAVSREGGIHIHQYTSCGSFNGCLSSSTISQPIVGIGVTGNGTLVVAEQNSSKLKLFEMLHEEVAL